MPTSKGDGFKLDYWNVEMRGGKVGFNTESGKKTAFPAE